MLAHVQAHVRGVRGIKGIKGSEQLIAARRSRISRSRIKCSDPLIPLIPREGSPEADTHIVHIPVICVLSRYDISSSACTMPTLNMMIRLYRWASGQEREVVVWRRAWRDGCHGARGGIDRDDVVRSGGLVGYQRNRGLSPIFHSIFRRQLL